MKDNMNTPAQIILDIFLNHGDRDFIVDAQKEITYSYKSFLEKALVYAQMLQDLGIQQGDQLVLLLPNSLEMVVLIFAAWISGVVVVAIDPIKGEKELESILDTVSYAGMITDSKYHSKFSKSINISQFKWNGGKAATFQKGDLFKYANEKRVDLITFTSGTTGNPKGVMHSFTNLLQTAGAFNKYFAFDHKNTFLHNLPMSYMAGILNQIVLPFAAGSRIIISERFGISNIHSFWDDVIKYSVNTFWFTPTILSMLLKLDRGTRGSDYCKDRHMIGCVGTAPLNQQIRKRFEQRYGIPLYESYGLSETLFISTNYPGIQEGEYSGVGKLLEGVELVFCEDKEILINVPWQFIGYTEHVDEGDILSSGSFSSGDYGELDKQGRLMITGRKKDLIIRGGINISPRKIEELIARSDIFEEYAVLGMDDQIIGEKTICVYVKRDQGYNDDLRKELSRKITAELGKDYTIDQYIEFSHIPKNTIGKIDKRAIKEQLIAQCQADPVDGRN